ncbi:MULTISPECIES: CDP-glycerol glycerophosphotransferase family protein [Falsihalocynthiibacter]|uniref:CDP-glycerol glycerophosphotransferase family protein n=1 Tax=Falsihalocynthiibacter TaxID=2854182 RepID=UPI003002852C
MAPVKGQRAITHFVPRVALAVRDLEMLNHYKGILLNMPRESTCVLGSWDVAEEKDPIIAFARKHGYQAISPKRAYETGMKFAVMVSHHPFIFKDQNRPKLVDLAHTHVRLMYALGKAGWNFREWNKMYHTVLCWGPYHAEMLAKYPKIQTKQIGYPRFDSYFDNSLNRDKILQDLGCDPKKLVVTWLPTWSTLSSVATYSDAVAKLKDDYNLLVKLHPGMYADAKSMEILRKNGIPLLSDRYINNVQMFYVTDYVLADYGGSPFGAIYTGKKLLLLNIEDAAQSKLMGEDSLDLKIRDWVLNIDADKRFDIPKILADDTIWERQMSQYADERAYFFAPYHGNSGRVAAHTLLDMLLNEITSPSRMIS